jgi:hypothetical protein
LRDSANRLALKEASTKIANFDLEEPATNGTNFPIGLEKSGTAFPVKMRSQKYRSLPHF